MTVILVHPEASRPVSAAHLVDKCSLFSTNLARVATPYTIETPVSLAILDQFVAALADDSPNVTDDNYVGLFHLAVELGFHTLAAQVMAFRPDVVLVSPGHRGLRRKSTP
jgi:hypothetical protein